MGSCSAEVSSTSRGEYCVSKAAVSMLTTLFADRLAPEGILVNEVRPGVIATDMNSVVTEKYDTMIKNGVFPIARWGKAEDVAEMIAFFCSDSVLYTTGNYVDVDGGFSHQEAIKEGLHNETERAKNRTSGHREAGAAGFQSALRLYQNGEWDLTVVTENINAGTSRNTGSDKQTYYKLTLSGKDPDSVENMAEDLFAGQCVDGDQALCEAALSARCFFCPYRTGGSFSMYRTGRVYGI